MTGPACPNCGKRPLTMDMFTGRFPNGIIASIVHCHDCGHVLPAFMNGIEQPQTVPAGSGPRLVG